jgi:DNA gyrase/topoisomerase IV subunit B
MDEPPTVAGVEVLDTDVEPAVFRSVPQAPTSLAIANALSEEMTIESRRGGIATSALFSRGRLFTGPRSAPTQKDDGILLVLVPDLEVFGPPDRRFHPLAEVVRDFSAVRRVRAEIVDESRNLRFAASPWTG